jgi:exopolysaccharide biosynthesis polyprenyl glycosylphosphotransferase
MTITRTKDRLDTVGRENIHPGPDHISHPVVHSSEVPPVSRGRKRAGFPLLLLDILVIVLSFLGSYYLRFQSGLWVSYQSWPVHHYLGALPAAMLIFIGAFSLFGMYETRRCASFLQLLVESMKPVLAGTLVLLALSFWYREYEYSRWTPVLNAGLLTLGAASVRTLYIWVLGRFRAAGRGRLRLLVIGTGPSARKSALAIREHPELGYDVAGYLGPADGGVESEEILGPMAALLPVIRARRIQEVVIAPERKDREDISRLVHRCRSEGVGVKLVPDITDLVLGERDLRFVDNLFWVEVESSIAELWQRALKRAFDLLASLIFLAASLPVQAAVALAIRLDSPGPVIFRQWRAGENGKPFQIYKFRSMVCNAEELLPGLVDVTSMQEPVFKIPNDPRRTRVGRILRRWSLDEIPQFWNVLRGEMSIVGPRPEELRIASLYDDRASERLRIRPGITGFQQVHCRGTEQFNERLRYDLYYINNQSLFLDLLIILQTIGVVIRGEGRH